jgi:hypothetical protein
VCSFVLVIEKTNEENAKRRDQRVFWFFGIEFLLSTAKICII